MRSTSRGRRMFTEESSVRGQKFDRLRKNEPEDQFNNGDNLNNNRQSNGSSAAASAVYDTDPLMISDISSFDPTASPFSKSPWSSHVNNMNRRPPSTEDDDSSSSSPNALVGSLIREEGHIYSLAASGDLLYTGSDSKNIRVWKNQEEFTVFKSNSGLVKAIVVAGNRIFTGHQDGRIRVWKISSKNGCVHKRVGTIPTLKDYIKSSVKPNNHVETKRHVKHYDAISALGLSEDRTLLYSASWDKTFKVWRISDSKCLESITAHDDAVNALVTVFNGSVFTGSADGTVKVWRRELQGKGTKHFFEQTLLKQECAVTSLAINHEANFVYCGSSDGLINYWERDNSLSHGGVLRGHKLAVLCLATAGNLVFSGSADMGIYVWKRTEDEHACLSVLTGHSGPVKCLAVEKDYHTTSRGGENRWIVYSGSLDKSVKMWKVSDQAPTMEQNPEHHTLNRASSFSSRGRIGSRRH